MQTLMNFMLFNLPLISGTIVSILLSFLYYKRVGRMAYYLRKCPSAPTVPFVGSMPHLMGGILRRPPPHFLVLWFQWILGEAKLFKGFYVFWIGWNPIICISKPKMVEAILSSNKLIEKSINYDLLRPWLGNGLLTNTGDKWRARRKLLTPAFHFRIIDDFIPIMSEHSMTFVETLKELGGRTVDICPLVTNFTLDTICETAMGVKVNAQKDSKSDYVRAVSVLGQSFMRRIVDMSGWFDFVFFRTSFGKEYLKSLKILHDFSRKVIRERKQELLNRVENKTIDTEFDAFGFKKRTAFLDLLLEHHLSSDSQLSLEDIREEVDTFMFEGHDTTAVALCWSLLMIGLDPEVQRRINEEIEYVFGDDKSRPITSTDVKQLKYIECCIKETLRLFPSVPVFARLAHEDFQLSSYTIPKGTTIFVIACALHRNEQVYSQPEVFRPNRFMSETIDSKPKINPYSYVPFSAGPRNCIGQRFAMTEQKIVLANLFRNFNIKSVSFRDNVRAGMEMVIRPQDPIIMQFIAK